MHTTSYNPAHDKAQLLARRHERDLYWAKERRRQHEREAAEARALVAARPLRLARSALWTGGSLLAVTALAWAVALLAVDPSWSVAVDSLGTAVALAVVVAVGIALGRIRSRRSAARALLRNRGDRLSHTQYHIHESVHSFIDARVDVVNTRASVPA